MEIGDYITCKHNFSASSYNITIPVIFEKNKRYRIDNIQEYTTSSTTVLVRVSGSIIKNYFINYCLFLEKDIIENFYSKREERKLKLDLINENR